MNTLQKGLQLILAVLALGFVSATQAVPTLALDSDLIFDGSFLHLGLVNSVVNSASPDILPAPDLPGTFTLDAAFLGSSYDGTTTTGNFGSLGGNELVIKDKSGSDLLTADLSSLVLYGDDGGPDGTMEGVFTGTGGSLLGYFGQSKVFTFATNLTVNFSSTMYTDVFMGHANGDLTSLDAPEPGMLALLSLGLALLGIQTKRRRSGAVA